MSGSATRRVARARTTAGVGAAGAGAAGIATAVTRTLRRAGATRTADVVDTRDSDRPPRSIAAGARTRATAPRGAATTRACACNIAQFIPKERDARVQSTFHG
jgi:hypothetical protein